MHAAEDHSYFIGTRSHSSLNKIPKYWPVSLSIDNSNLDEGLESLCLVCALERDFDNLEDWQK